MIVDDGIDIDLNEILQEAHNHYSTVFLSNTGSIEKLIHESPIHFFRGEFFATILIFFNNPEPFLTQLSFNNKWNPDYLILVSLNRNLDTKFILGHDVIQRSRYILLCEQGRVGSETFKLYSSKPHKKIGKQDFTKELIGTWNGGKFTTEIIFQERFDNFYNKTLHVTSWCEHFPYLYHSNDICVGVGLDILTMLSNHLNFSFAIQTEPEDSSFGFTQNGTELGMIGEVIHGNKDIALNPPFIYGLANIDVSNPFYHENFVVALRLPPPIQRWRTAFYPFTYLVWIIIFASTFGAVVLLTGVLTILRDTEKPGMAFLIVSIRFYFKK